MGVVTLVTVDSGFSTQATVIIIATRRCGRPPVQSTTPTIMITIITTITNTRAVIELITVVFNVTFTNMTM
jgi:hypothetical protein